MKATELDTKGSFTTEEARAIATELGIDFGALGCDLEQFRMGLGVELEHGPRDPETDVSGNDPIVTGKIALAHLTEFPDYYTRPGCPGERSGRAPSIAGVRQAPHNACSPPAGAGKSMPVSGAGAPVDDR